MARVLLRFIKRLLKDFGRKFYLVLYNLRVHHTKFVQAWLERHNEMIDFFYLPTYSPHLNPGGYLDSGPKAVIKKSSPARNESDLKGKVPVHMKMLQKKPERLAKYFKHPPMKYAA